MTELELEKLESQRRLRELEQGRIDRAAQAQRDYQRHLNSAPRSVESRRYFDAARAEANRLASERRERAAKTRYMRRMRAGRTKNAMARFRKRQLRDRFRQNLSTRVRRVMKNIPLSSKSKPVRRLDTNEVFVSLHAAARDSRRRGFNVNKTNISKAVINGWMCAGSRWEWAGAGVYHGAKRCLNLTTGVIYESAQAAARAMGVTRRAIAIVIDKAGRRCRGCEFAYLSEANQAGRAA